MGQTYKYQEATEKVLWSKTDKMNKPINKMHLRKQTYSADTVRAGIAKAKRIYSKSKHLDVAYRKKAVGKGYSFTVRAFY